MRKEVIYIYKEGKGKGEEEGCFGNWSGAVHGLQVSMIAISHATCFVLVYISAASPLHPPTLSC